ncbi:putative protein phosphatase 2C 23 [Brachypodium distachyon]|uniref:putative protein phosphatase 2C 23 n=1 Tax=Brachypodium distachyon TaxID=15368 RepID=UPI0001C720F1|nr:putative protein phosphatase 2C 23 [Brachypodium distachyon]|eukprot:XP_024314489.1 putative protein phosphatase 2C 23 [Brachypodium distachyon]
MDWAACSLPLHGEDAHFGAGNLAGVGGYRKDGVDAGAFARGLMARAYAEALVATKLLPGGTRDGVRPKALLELAYQCTAASGATGASTAVILSLDGNGRRLRWANIGDSGFAVFRGPRSTIAHRSRPQQSRFNRPFRKQQRGGGESCSSRGGKEDDITVSLRWLQVYVTQLAVRGVVVLGTRLKMRLPPSGQVLLRGTKPA